MMGAVKLPAVGEPLFKYHGLGNDFVILTQACGTGACATVAAGVREGRLPADKWIRVTLPGGPLQLRVSEDLSEVRMRGPATFVFEGTLPPAGDL